MGGKGGKREGGGGREEGTCRCLHSTTRNLVCVHNPSRSHGPSVAEWDPLFLSFLRIIFHGTGSFLSVLAAGRWSPQTKAPEPESGPHLQPLHIRPHPRAPWKGVSPPGHRHCPHCPGASIPLKQLQPQGRNSSLKSS